MEPQPPPEETPPPLPPVTPDSTKLGWAFAIAFFGPFVLMAIVFLILHIDPKADAILWIPMVGCLVGGTIAATLFAQRFSHTGIGFLFLFLGSAFALVIVYLVAFVAGCMTAAPVSFH